LGEQTGRKAARDEPKEREDNMIDFFIEGGWGMWPVLVFGMVTLGAAGRFMRKPETSQLKFVAAMALATAVATIHATWMNVSMVFKALSDPQRVPDADLTRTLFVGFMESTRPGTLSGTLLTLASLFVAIGFLRAQKKAA
jgi:hypothetical protein